MLSRKARIAIFLLLFLELFLVTTSYTDADLFAERNVRENRFSAIVVNFFSNNTANNTAVQSLFQTTGLQSNGFETKSVRIKNDTNKDLKYSMRATKSNGDDHLCNALKMQVLTRDFTSKYDGPLLDLDTRMTLNKDAINDWIFLLYLDDSDAAVKSKLCEFTLIFRSYRDSPNETGGVFAQRKLSNIISSGN